MAARGIHQRSSDQDLLAAIAVGDREACTVFYRRHLRRTVAFLIRETHDPEVAADITAEVFAAVIIGAGRYRPQTDSAGAWVIGIARNVLGKSRRRRRVEDRIRQRLGMEPIDFTDDDVDATVALGDDPGRGVVELVEALPDNERSAIKARVVDERPYREIATELRCSELVVRKRVSRGLARLRRQLEEN
jgi:RNA polymerase sigma factor (sigma-70 family)